MHATAEGRNITVTFGTTPLPSLTQKLGSVGTVELDGCACDLLVALYNDESQFERKHQLSFRAGGQGLRSISRTTLNISIDVCHHSDAKLALPWTGTADLMLAPRKVLDICAAAMVNQVFFSRTDDTLLDDVLWLDV